MNFTGMGFTNDSPNQIPVGPYLTPAAPPVVGAPIGVGGPSRYEWPLENGPGAALQAGPYPPGPQTMNVPPSVKAWQGYCVQLSKQAIEAATIAKTAASAAEAAAQALAKIIANPPTDPYFIAALPDLLKAEGAPMPRMPPKMAIRSLNNTLRETGQPMIAADGTKITTLKNRRRNQKKRQREREEREQQKKAKQTDNKTTENGGTTNENGESAEDNKEGEPAMEAEETQETQETEAVE